jgi:hypothetical protein
VSLYRQAGERGPALLISLLLIGLLVGGAAGFLAGRGSADDASAAEVVADARAELAPVAAGLELVPIEYEGAVSKGKVTAQTEYEATQSAAARATEELEASEGIRAIDPDGYEAATAAIEKLERAIAAVAPPTRIEALAEIASARLESLALLSK